MKFFCTWLVLTAKDAFSNMIAACSPGYGTPDRTITSKLSDKADGGAGYKTFRPGLRAQAPRQARGIIRLIPLIDPNVLIVACHERAFFASRMVEAGGIEPPSESAER